MKITNCPTCGSRSVKKVNITSGLTYKKMVGGLSKGGFRYRSCSKQRGALLEGRLLRQIEENPLTNPQSRVFSFQCQVRVDHR